MLKHLSLAEMVALLAPWVEDPKQQKLFLSIPEIAALHPRVVEAHEAVLAVQPKSNGMSPGLRALTEKSNGADRRHDHLARAASYGIDAYRALCLAEDPPDVAGAERCDVVQKKLFPDGLTILNTSPLAEAGNTARVARLIEDEPEIAAFLKTIPVRGKASLLDVVKRWIAAGRELQKIDHARAELEATEATTPPSKTTIQAARSQWFKVVSLVLSNLEISRAPARDIEILRGPVLRASERAGKRYGSGKAEEVAPEDTAGTAPEGAASGAPAPAPDGHGAASDSP